LPEPRTRLSPAFRALM